MCGRYTFFDESDVEEIARIIQEAQRNVDAVTQYKQREIFPTNNVPVIKANGNVVKIEIMKWGFAKWDKKGVIINARSETTSEKKTFSGPLKTQRCIVPTTGFYEWDSSKNKYHFSYKESPVMYLAGLYNTFQKDGEAYDAFTIFTRSANQSIINVHHRMPVILYPGELNNYLSDPVFADFVFKRDDVILFTRAA